MRQQAPRRISSSVLVSTVALCCSLCSCSSGGNSAESSGSNAPGATGGANATRTSAASGAGSDRVTSYGGESAQPFGGKPTSTATSPGGSPGGSPAGSGGAVVGAGSGGGKSIASGGATTNSSAKGGAATSNANGGSSSSQTGRGGNAATAAAGKGPGGGVSMGGGASRGGNSSTAGKGGLGATTGGSSGLAGTVSAIGQGGKTDGGGPSAGGPGVGGSSILEPASGALLGLYYGDASITATTTKIGRAAPIHLTYYAWEDEWAGSITTADLRAGRIPFVNWELFGANYDDIIAGKNDAMITARAQAAKNLGGKLFLDFGAEMNGDWSPWSGAENGNSSAKYLAAYRHVHDLFVASGATNVIWAFCPNVTSVPDASWNEPLDYYPGDAYVDWTCVDGYNWGTSESGGSWQSFYSVFKDIYAILATKNKPIIIGEMASTELGGNKAEWIAQIIPALKRDFPLIKGLIWFDINKETDWRISSSSESEAAFKAMATDPWFAQ